MSTLRYALLHHTGIERPHFDLLLEAEPGDALLTTFRIQTWPPNVDDVFEELPEHRRAYLDYEGPVSGDRGRVDRVDAGVIAIVDLSVDPPTLGLRLESSTRPQTQIVLIEIGATTRWTVSTITD